MRNRVGRLRIVLKPWFAAIAAFPRPCSKQAAGAGSSQTAGVMIDLCARRRILGGAGPGLNASRIALRFALVPIPVFALTQIRLILERDEFCLNR